MVCLWPQALRENGPAHCPKAYLWAQLLTALHELHSLCLPWAPALVTTGFKRCPPRKSWGASHFSLSFASTLLPPEVGHTEATLPGAAGSATEQAEVALARSFPCPSCCLASPPPSPSGSLQPSVPATQDPLPEPGCSWSPSGLCPVPPQGEQQLHPDSSLCSPGSLSHVVSGDRSVPHP